MRRRKAECRLDRFYLAADAVVDPVTRAVRCRVTAVSGHVPDCVPLNVFGRGRASTAAVDWIKGFDPDVAVTTRPFVGFDANGQPSMATPTATSAMKTSIAWWRSNRRCSSFPPAARCSPAGPATSRRRSARTGARKAIDQKVQASQGNTAADATYRPVWCPDTVVAANNNASCISQVSRGYRPAGNIGVQGVPANSLPEQRGDAVLQRADSSPAPSP